MKDPQSTCLYCRERDVGCHGRCVAYKDYQREVEAYREEKARLYASREVERYALVAARRKRQR